VSLLQPFENLLLYGLTGAGKTAQLLEMIKAMTAATDKKALAYVSDWGSLASLKLHAAGGQLELEEYKYPTDPFVWIDGACTGRRLVNGKWLPGKPGEYCLIAMESLTGMGDLVTNALGHQVAEGKQVGGNAMAAPKLAIQADGYVINVAANSPTHYHMAQKYLLEKVWQSQTLGVPVVWTAHEDVAMPLKRDDQGNLRPEVAVDVGVQGMIGPLVAGHALTMHLAKYFVYTFRLKQEVKPSGTQHVLLTARHKDGLYEGLANNRAPLGVRVPERVVPADVVQVLQAIQKARKGVS